jgi:putative membrane protein insertion efficiency factor
MKISKIINKTVRYFLTFFVRLYQILISPFISQNACRFNPSCSEYMIQAIEKKGVFRGLYLGSLRLLRCNPWSKGGDDFVK